MTKSAEWAIIYARVSGKRQLREGNGLKSQEQRCRQYAKMKGYTVIAVFKEKATTGYTQNRPEMEEMLAFLKRQAAGVVVIVDDPKRWARNVIAHFSLKDEVIKRGGRLESPSFLFEDTPIGRYTETIYAAGAELERNQNKEQVLNRMRARLEMGFWPFPPPPGYVWRRHPSYKKVLALDEPKAAVIKQVLEEFAYGSIPSKMAIVRRLTESGYFAKPKFPSLALGHVDRILGNILYTGYLEYPSWQVPLRKAHHPALITMATYKRIQERLAGNDQSFSRKDERSEFPLRNFVLCNSCGYTLTASWSHGEYSRYAYYHCRKRLCPMYGKTIPIKVMEERFRGLLRNLRSTDSGIETIRGLLHEEWRSLSAEVERKRSERPKRIAAIGSEIGTLVDRLVEVSSKTAVRAIEERIETMELQRLELQAGSDEDKYAGVDVGTAIERGLEAVENPLLAWETGTFKTKRILQSHIFASPIRHDRNSGFGTPDLRLPFLISTTVSHPNFRLVDLAEISWNRLLEEIIQLGVELGDFPDTQIAGTDTIG